MESLQRDVLVDTTCNGVDIPSAAPCQGLYDSMAHFADGMLKQECSGSFTPIKESKGYKLFELLSTCQGEGQISASAEGNKFSMTMTDTCTTKETVFLRLSGLLETIVSGVAVKFCVGNSTSTQHFAGAKEIQLSNV